MPNMSYCRFHNTVMDLEDCYEALLSGDEISEAELPHALRLLEMCSDIIHDEQQGYFAAIEDAQQ